MKKIFLLLMTGVLCAATHAQDKIYVRAQEIGRPQPPAPWRPQPPGRQERPIRNDFLTEPVISAKILEINETLVQYKRFENPDGPTYSLQLNRLDSIVFASGTVQRFSRERRMPAYKLRERAEYADLNTNLISGGFGVFLHRIRFLSSDSDPDFTPFIKAYLSYEKIFANDRLGVEVSPFIALNKKGYGSMLNAKFYPKNYGKFRIGFGPAYTFYVRDKTERYYVSDPSTMGGNVKKTYQTMMSVLAFGTSMQMHVDRNLFINYNASIGGVVGYKGQTDPAPAGWSKGSQTGMGQGEMRLGLGYRF